MNDTQPVFKNVFEAISNHTRTPDPAKSYVFGVDFGNTHDYTAIAILDTQDKTLVGLERVRLTVHATLDLLYNLYEKWQPKTILTETQGIWFDELMYQEYPVKVIQNARANKNALIENLAQAFDNYEIKIFEHPNLINELLACRLHVLANGNCRYGAPENFEDDTVIALALAWWASKFNVTVKIAEIIAQQRAEIERLQAQLSNLTTVTINGKTITLAPTDTDAQDLSGMVSGVLWDKDE